jgi:hypothetical protein
MSESGIKKIMTGDDVSLARLSAICRAADIDLFGLLEASWKAPPVPYQYTEEQSSFFADNPAYLDFLKAFLDARLDPEVVAREHDLDKRSVLLYLRKLEDLDLISETADGAWRSSIPAPYRMATPAGLELRGPQAFLQYVIDRKADDRRLLMGSLRMTRAHYDSLKRALEDAIIEHGVMAHHDELVTGDHDLIAVSVLGVAAECRPSDFVSVPRLD